jgi:sugar phosphate isomerase/epimerase
VKLGILSRTIARETLGETLDAVVGYGITHLQLNLVSASLPSMPSLLTEAECDRIRREFEQRGLINAVLSATFNIIHPDQEVRSRGFDSFNVLARLAKRLGADTLSVSTGTRDADDMWRKHAENDSDDAWRDMLAAMSHLAAIAEEQAVTVAFEPEQANVVDTSKKARTLMDELQSKHVKVLIDAANLLNLSNLSRQDHVLKEAFDLLGEDLAAAHAKEFCADGQLGKVALGRGVVDFPLYVNLLRGAGYQGSLLMHGFPETAIQESLDYLGGVCRPAAHQ